MINEEVILTEKECRSIIELNDGFKRSKVHNKGSKRITSTNRTNYESIIESKPIVDLLLPKLSKYDIISLPEYCNVARYNEGEWFAKHVDAGPANVDKKRFKTLIVQLSNPDDYEGGELVIWDQSNNEIVSNKAVGNMILFESKLMHQANKVKSGIRYSLVFFLRTDNFKINKPII